MAQIVPGVHSIDGLDHPIPTVGMVSYLIEEKPGDYTLVDTCFACSIPTFESYLSEASIDIKDINRIVLTHLHPDHVEAVNALKKKTAAKIYSHWIEAAYLSHELQYNGPPDRDALEHVLKLMGTSIDIVTEKFGNLKVGPIVIDGLLKDGDKIGNTLQVIHTPGHTPGHISLYDKERRILIGGDILFNSILNTDGLFVPPPVVTKDWQTSIVSAKNILNLKVDKLLLAHQSTPILENAQQMIEKAVSVATTQKNTVTK
ncbi:MBL fold metallo-hydrolase [Candidatus Nitrosocosmicus sp. FF01]|uniref:MBL fold metallo-hydrolase n=1 Tax=Candidatus Nitrosocosmicus sp. FF01 TaxID=3397670 RepID=UPI0039EB4CC8